MPDNESNKKTVLWQRSDMPWGAEDQTAKLPDDAPLPGAAPVPPTPVTPAPSSGSKTVLFGAAGMAGVPEDPMNNPVAGWLVITNGPGKGAFVKIGQQVNTIGREYGNSIVLNFNDMTISGSEHAEIIYDPLNRKFYMSRKSGKNLAYVNNAPVLQVVELQAGDLVRLGATEMRFVPFCGPGFDWSAAEAAGA